MSRSILLTAILAALLGYLAGRMLSEDSPEHPAANSSDEVASLASGQQESAYFCPMHPEIFSDSPGICPICGMDLVREERGAEGKDGEAGHPVVTVDPSVVHNLGMRTAVVEFGDLRRSIETIGKITRIDPMARRTITPPVRGELVYVADKQQGDFVDAGELLFSVKSDVLFENEKAFQDTYLAGDRATANAMIPKLSKMGLTSDQIARLQSGTAPEMPVEVHAFEDGFVYTRRGHAGEAVHTGYTVFNVGGNYRVVEVTAEIFERQWGWVVEGQQARMTVRGLPGTVFAGEVVRVEPPVGYTTRSLEVGLRFRSNDPALSQSMFAHISIDGQPLKNVMTVPTDSVIRTGEGDRVVLVRGENRYQPVAVVAGEEAGGKIEIRSGLQAGDRVVASGQFLIDSESSLQAGFRRLGAPGAAPVHRHAESDHQHEPAGDATAQESRQDTLPASKQQIPDGDQQGAYAPASGY